MAMLIINLNNIPTELHRSPDTYYGNDDNDAFFVYSGGDGDGIWNVSDSYGKYDALSGGLRSPYAVGDSYFAYRVNSSGVVYGFSVYVNISYGSPGLYTNIGNVAYVREIGIVTNYGGYDCVDQFSYGKEDSLRMFIIIFMKMIACIP